MMLKTHKTLSRVRDRKGAAAVEFAFVAPIFFAVTFFCFEFARMSMIRNLAHNAAYEACRFAMMEGATANDGRREARKVLRRLNVRGARITTTFEPIYRSDGSVAQEKAFVKTRIVIPLWRNSILFPRSVLRNRRIVSETQLRSERYLGYFDSN